MMGLSFSNIQIRRTENELDFAQIAAVLTEGRDTSAVDSEEEADIMLSVFTMSDSPWITVCSDLIDGDFEELGANAANPDAGAGLSGQRLFLHEPD